MDNKVIIASLLSQLSSQELNFLNLKNDDIIISKDDKKIGVIGEKGIEEIFSSNDFTKVSTTNGYITMPINIGDVIFSELIIQWGRVDLAPLTDTTFNYNIPFTDACFIIMPNTSYFGNISVVKADKVSNSQFKMKSLDGTETSRVFWFAIGV